MGARCLTLLLLTWSMLLRPAPACCPAPPRGKPVVNADQTVIILWDPDTKTQHFIRQASFKSEADDFGFLIPSPSQPELEESGNDAFPYLLKLTEPPRVRRSGGGGNLSCGCSKSAPLAGDAAPAVMVLAEKRVAGFDAVVLEAKSADALVAWLKEHGYAFSPEVQAWAQPYVDSGWKITALKVAKDKTQSESKQVAAGALRMSFQTDRPLFPYREPDTARDAPAVGARERLLRIYFIGEARYQGELTKDVPWTGKVAWAGPIKPDDKQKLLQMLKLPEATGPAQWWLTEFEDPWPYRLAPADVYFARDANQQPLVREPIAVSAGHPWPGDVTAFALLAALVLPPLVRRWRRTQEER